MSTAERAAPAESRPWRPEEGPASRVWTWPAGDRPALQVWSCARGYHCGIIPVDSGMVTKLAPALGMTLPSSPFAHEHMPHVLESAVRARPADFRALADLHGHQVTIPEGADPTWWVHLVLIYFKRLYLNGPSPLLCRRRPVCSRVTDCSHTRR